MSFLGGIFSKETKTTTNTTNNYTDNSSNAAEGAVAAGAGANVSITTADPGVALGAIAGNQNVSIAALSSNRDVSLVGIDTTARIAANAINSVVTLREAETREKIDSLNSANLALQSNQGLATKLADLTNNALQRSQDPGSDTSKIALYVGGAIGIVLVLALFSKKGKTA